MRRTIALAALLVAATGAEALAAPAPPLGHEGRWLTDAHGRAVILHGFNLVHKVGSYRPADTGFGRDDARFLRRNGFNAIRLGIIYKGLEPDPPGPDGAPRYRRGYLRSLKRSERTLARHGVFTMLDFHQDLFNERFQGEGWPDWQVLDDGVPSQLQQGFPANYLVNLGLQRAFDNFWANRSAQGVPLQDAYADAWARVAATFKRRPHVMGYDLLNEPWPGSAFPTCVSPLGCPLFDAGPLTEFSNRTIARIREVDRRTLVFYEPLLTFDFGAETAHADTGDPNAGFSFHDYCLPAGLGFGAAPQGTCDPLEELVFENADEHVERTGDVPFLTEFGATDDLATIERLVRFSDDHLVSWHYWHYCDCDDPTTQGPGVQSLVVDPSRPPRGDNVKRAKLEVLARPYPQAVAGTPQRIEFDPKARVLELDYATAAPAGERLPRRLATEVFLPRIQYPDGYVASADGARIRSPRDARVLELKRRRGAAEVTLTVAPR
ncbi:MAG: cellulase family glycosylhydrolase [Solirubrobacterales bacterium]